MTDRTKKYAPIFDLGDIKRLQFKQVTHGPHRSPEKKFKSINTSDYIIMLIKRNKIPLSTLRDLNGSSFEKT